METGRQHHPNPRPTYCIKGIPAIGVLAMHQISRKWSWSLLEGIGPVLGGIADLPATHTIRLTWAKPDPLKKYSTEIIEAAKTIDKRAVVNIREPVQEEQSCWLWLGRRIVGRVLELFSSLAIQC